MPKAWHKTLADGKIVLKAETRAWVGNRLPPVCWAGKNSNLNFTTPFAGRRVA